LIKVLSFSGVPGTSRSKESVATRNIERRTQNTKRTRPEAGDANPLLLYVTICGAYGRRSDNFTSFPPRYLVFSSQYCSNLPPMLCNVTVTICEIYGRKSGNLTGFPARYLGFSSQYCSILPLMLYNVTVTIFGIYGRQSGNLQVFLRYIWFPPVNIVPFYHQCYTILLRALLSKTNFFPLFNVPNVTGTITIKAKFLGHLHA